ncbi:sirohydrochlorin cobaltochelatase [Vallitalea okinawensis]|uniref:sirohydrochlorin cobaltochelatase n=1 Tax=Vallitalea okinawensis TaxID=2078660 RepID=UPI000CFE0E9C|nr:sirohydrochlorin cobaltochelatase [Vallitalea okinawensis]
MKNAIVVVSFGSSMEHVINTYIQPVEKAIKAEFTDAHVIRAFTSTFIRKRLGNKGVHILSPEEAIEKLISEGFDTIRLQPLHIIPGYEYEKIEEAYRAYKDQVKLYLSQPLLFSSDDYSRVVNAIKPHLPELSSEEALLFMGHGTNHPANATYFCMDHHFKKIHPNIFMSNIEGIPLLEETIHLLKEKGIKKVNIMPFLLVAGDHAHNDMASDEPDSWKSQLLREDFEVEVIMTGLGSFPSIHKIFVEKLRSTYE